jgi:C-terminal processing protease CtpA/Prc
MASGTECGVGITIKILDNGQCTVINTIPGGSAHEAGKITPGDLLLGVFDKERSPDFVSTSGLDFNEIKSLIVGPHGSRISLKLQHTQGNVRTGEYICENLVREPIVATAIDRGANLNIPLEVR